MRPFIKDFLLIILLTFIVMVIVWVLGHKAGWEKIVIQSRVYTVGLITSCILSIYKISRWK